MGVSSSRVEEDKALQLCRDRKKFVRQALDGRCALAAAHVAYIQSLRSTGVALKKFVEPEALVESSLYTSTTATPEPLALTEKTHSQFSFSSPSVSQHIDATEIFSPTPSPPSSSRIHINHMKFSGNISKKVEEKPPIPFVGTVTTSSTPQNTTPRSTEVPQGSPFEDTSLPSETLPWDFFGLFHPVDHQTSFQEDKAMSHEFEHSDDINRLREEEGIPELEDDEERTSLRGKEDSQDSEDEFDEPATVSLVRSFENFNRVHDTGDVNASTSVPSAGTASSETKSLNGGKNTLFMPSTETAASSSEVLNGEKSKSPDLSPLRAKESVVVPVETNKPQVKEGCIENKVVPKDLFSSMKDIEFLFSKASDSGKEVPRMLEANKLHFRPMLPGKQSGPTPSTLLKTCFSCGEEDPSQVQEEPVQTDVKYITWHRTASSRSSSSRYPVGANSKDDIEDLTGNVFENIGMVSGSHVSTLDRLYAWERKLYDEVKASETVRREYDIKCRFLRQLESNAESSQKIDKTRSDIKDLHSRIRVAIHRIYSISKRIEEIRDKELQPQLEELIDGLSRMWEVMLECHKLQFDIISVALNNGNTKLSVHSESHRQSTLRLENELNSLSSSFSKWIIAQKSYIDSLNKWLFKCVSIAEGSTKRKRKSQSRPNVRNFGPPIYVVCDFWLEEMNLLQYKDVVDSIKNLAAETSRLLPRQEKKDGKADNKSDSAVDGLRDEGLEDFISGFNSFRSSLVAFFGQLNKFADSSVQMYGKLDKAIENAKRICERSQSQTQSQFQF
ncbi:protein ROLLING AND ERECT LEAF 2 [Humulus lupulus]|uniref:protein ROLLING AND ERECT LEAF 2 n=1 Tax=Humulus lupulus TaxID=3486 RepID=UPI002B4031B6|nr:protein ROLLING AND ERECT LEAF 2 [Humulus lupulus]XP_062082432.1 protein ROLLING AND ERECT LEAF 2 [Humulus lupulus]